MPDYTDTDDQGQALQGREYDAGERQSNGQSTRCSRHGVWFDSSNGDMCPHCLDAYEPISDGLRLVTQDYVATNGQGQADAWEAPTPFDALTVPPFPTHVFPGWIRLFVEALSVSTQTPPDVGAMLVLAVLATAAARRAFVDIRPGWWEPLNLFIAAAMPPGSRKTVVFQRVTTPLENAETAAMTLAAPAIREAMIRQRVATADAEKAQAIAERADEGNRRDAVNAAVTAVELAESIVVPVQPRLLADNATPEALKTLLYKHDGKMALFSDEGDVFKIMRGRYGQAGSDLEVYLKGHSGSSIRVDRASRPAEKIRKPALTLGLAVQPEVLRGLYQIEGARGVGLPARFLWAVPPSNIGTRKIRPAPVPGEVAQAYNDNMEALVHLLASLTDPVALPVDPDADELLADLERLIERRMGPAGDLSHMSDWAGKLAGAVARIAGLLHLATFSEKALRTDISYDTMASAIDLADYLIAHAQAAFHVMDADPAYEKAIALLPWIAGHTSFTRRDVQNGNRSRFPKATDVDPVLAVLIDHGYIRRQPSTPVTGRGRPASPRFDVNPLAAEE